MSAETDAPPSLFGRWSDVLGHQRVLGALRRAVAHDRPHHAYCFLGPRGVGKKTVSRALVSALLCDGPGSEPCGACAACRQLAGGTHTGVHVIEPGGKSNSISVDQIAEIQRQLAYRRLEGSWRVVLIDDAGSMNDSAQNKLLKTLEEPPEGTVLILCALHPGQLLQTVRSRCQKLGLGVVPTDDVERWLIESQGAEPTAAREAAIGSRGVPGQALELLDPEASTERRERLQRLAHALAGDPGALAETVGLVDRDKEGCGLVLQTLQELLRDAMVRQAGSEAALVHPDVEIRGGPLLTLTAPALATWAQRIEDVQEKLDRNVHPGGLLEDLLQRLRAVA